MYESIDHASQSVAKSSVNYAVLLRWVLAHLILLSPVLILFIRAWTSARNDPGACLILPLIIVGAFAAQALGVAKVFPNHRDHNDWMLAVGVTLVVIIVVIILVIFNISRDFILSPWIIVLLGVLLGSFESVALRPVSKRAWWWIVANAVGFTLAVFATMQLSAAIFSTCGPNVGINSECASNAIIISTVTGVAIFSVITGATLVSITRTPSSVR